MNSESLDFMDNKIEGQNIVSINLEKQSMKIIESEENKEKYKFANFSDQMNYEKYYSYFKCTKCDKSFRNKIEMGEVLSIHPILKVLMCDTCCNFYGAGNFSKRSDEGSTYCRWCGEKGTIFLCSNCICGFCKKCIKKHFGDDIVEKIKAEKNWKCYFCDPKPLWFLRGITFLAKRISKVTRDCLKQKEKKKVITKNEEILSFSDDDSSNEIHNSNKKCQKRMKILSFSSNSSNHSLKNLKQQNIVLDDHFCSSNHQEDMESTILKKENIGELWKIIEIVSEIGLNESKENLRILKQPSNLKSSINFEKEFDKLKTVLSILLTFLKKASDSVLLLQGNSNIFNEEESKMVECSLWIETIKRFINSTEFKSTFSLKFLAGTLNAALESLKIKNLNEYSKSLKFHNENFEASLNLFDEKAKFSKPNEKENHLTFKFSCENEEKPSILLNSKSEKFLNYESNEEDLNNQNSSSNLSKENDEMQKRKIIDKKNFFDSDWEESCTESSSDSEKIYKKKEKTETKCCNHYSNNFSESNSEEKELQNLLKMTNLTNKEKNSYQKMKKIKTSQNKLTETDYLKKNQDETLINFCSNGDNGEKKSWQNDVEMHHVLQGNFEAAANAGLKSMYLMSSDDSIIDNEKEKEKSEKKSLKKKLEETKKKARRKIKDFNYTHFFYSTSESEKEEEMSDSNSTEIEKNININLNINNFSPMKFKDCNIEQNFQTNSNQRKGRKNIKKIIKKEFLKLGTKEARKLENERKERITEREKYLVKEFGVDNNKLILDFDFENKKELLTVDENLAEKLKPHQRMGVKFMWNCCFESLKRIKIDGGSGCILAHCMGLGKTLQVITLVHTLLSKNTGIQSVLIMTPLNVIKYWINEFEHWLSKCKYQVKLYNITSCKTKKDRWTTIEKWINNGGVLLIHYEIFRLMLNPKKKKNSSIRNDYLRLLDPGPNVIILDEGHLLKNDSSALNKSIAKIKTLRRIILTGTPLQNNLLEYYCMVDFVKPNILGTKKEFMNRFVNPIKNGQFEDSTEQDVRLMKRRAHVLHTLLNGFVHRLGYNVLKSCIPEKQEYVIKVSLSKTQDILYRLFLEKFIKINDRLWNNFHCLQKIWTHPWILLKTKRQMKANEPNQNISFWTQHVKVEEFKDIKSSGKLILLFKILLGCKKLGDKIIVFSQFLKSLDMIEHFLKLVNEEKNSEFENDWKPGINYFRMDGTTTLENRSEFCRKFNDLSNNFARLFLISTRSGGLGINLVAANRVVLFDVSWNPTNDVQSIFRIYRFGQNKPCYIYRLIAEGTMEEKIYQRQVTKLSLAHRILDEYQIERHYSQSNLQELYRYQPLPKNQWEIPKLPKDLLFAEILATSKDIVVSYHEHDSLLENREEEELTEEERQAAWKDFEEDRATFSQATNIPEAEEINAQTTIFNNSYENQLPNESYMNAVNSEALNMVYQYRQSLTLTPKSLPLNQNWVLNENHDSICRIIDVRTLTLHP